LPRYEGLVRKTASMYYKVFNEEFEDFAQTLRVKVCEALMSYDSSKSKMTEEKYVFSCLRNRVKDYLRKLQVRNEAGWKEPTLIEDVAPARVGYEDGPRDQWDLHNFSIGEDAAYQALLADVPLLPSTLSFEEERVVALLYVGYNQVEIAKVLGVTRTAAIQMVQQIQTKMADWDPRPQTAGSAPIVV
jgi:RNA polymerase sigma factor (sigma-70 family)